MKFSAIALIALAAAGVQGQGNQQICNQASQTIQQLTQQDSFVSQQAAACVAGKPVQYNPHWAPYPVHSWPGAGTPKCNQMSQHANIILAQNAQTIQQQQAIMNQNGC